MTARLEMYVGSPENDPFGNYVFLDLILSDGTEVSLQESEEIGSVTGGEFIELLEKFLNRMSLFSKDLKLPIRLSADEFVALCIEEDFTEEVILQVKGILREIRAVNKIKIQED